MNVERWRQIEQLCHSALEQEPGHRDSFLAAACGNDEELRLEVQSLLQQSGATRSTVQRAGPMGREELLNTRTSLAPGDELGPYRILGPLGEGGMGKVYRALDTRLNRAVAIKISAEEFGQRFEREARAISALNHPNICTLYDVGPNYLVTELVDGQTLRDWLRLTPSRERSLEIARQILEALRSAHGAGIVHRDLKPANIMVRFDGYVKVLDFGLAKRLPSSQLLQTESSTQTDLTLPGQIAGTVPYMSPEQVLGKEVDPRSDLFAFGTILYEMLTGQHPWLSGSTVDTLHAIVHDDPPPFPATSQVSAEVAAVVRRLLQKSPAERYPAAEAVLAALAPTGSIHVSTGATGVSSKRRSPWGLVALSISIAAVLALIIWRWPHASVLRAVDLMRVTSDAGLTIDPALSRDGKMLAYASDRAGGVLNIWIQQVRGGDPIQVTKDSVDESEPSFSPDGTMIAFHSQRDGGGVYVVPALGGTPRRIADQGQRPRFSPDGEWLAYWVGDEGVYSRNRIYVVHLKTGEPRQLANTFFSSYYPLWSPSGKEVLFLGAESDQKPLAERYDWWVAPLYGGAPVATHMLPELSRNGVFPIARQPAEWAGESILFAGTTKPYAGLTQLGITNQLSIWRQRLVPNPWRTNGKAERVTSGAGIEAQPAIAGDRLALATTTENLDIWMLPLNGETGQVKADLERVTSSNASNQYPAVSRDGTKLAFASDRERNLDVYEKDLRSGTITALTATEVEELAPLPNADGLRVLYYVWRGDRKPSFSFWEVSARSGTPRQVCGDCDGPLYYWSKDERKVIYFKSRAGGPGSLVVRDLDSGEESVFATHPKYEPRLPRLSLDEQWVAFQTVVSQTQRKLFVAAVHDWHVGLEASWNYIPEARAPTTWSPSGNLLYFLSERDGFRCIWAQRLEPATKRPLGAAFAVKHLHTARRSLAINLEVGSIGLSLASDKLFFSMPERTGNVWIAQLEGRP